MKENKHMVYNGYKHEEDALMKNMFNRNTRMQLLREYKVEIITSTWQGNPDRFDILLEELLDGDNSKRYFVVKNNSSCGGKHLLLLCDGIYLLSNGGKSEGNILTIYGGD